jgi:glycine dehydrogenase subunit 1
MYISNTPDDIEAMLASIGLQSIDDLFRSLPDELRLKRPLNLPEGMGEIELTRHMSALASKNQAAGEAVCFLGGGAYDHFIPATVDFIASRSEFYTAYTPYQAEASQGSLQAFFEYQTLICQLTGMDVSNASLYEGGSAVAEALLMAIAVQDRKGEVILPESLHPEYRQTVITYLENLGCPVITVPTPKGYLDPDDLKKVLNDKTLAVVVQSPNFFGHLEEAETICKLAHAQKALAILSFDPIAMGLLKGPGAMGFDIAVAEGQSLGTPMGYGGPYLGILTCRHEYVRKIPGRLVGETTDRRGNRCWTLTLQTREQHIRREKATSNICTNQGLYALRAAIHLCCLGPQGLKETAELCLRKAHYAAEQLCSVPGVKLKFDRPFFKEFAIQLPTGTETAEVLIKLRNQGIFAGLNLGRWYNQHTDSILVAVTENRTKEEIDRLVTSLHGILTGK